MAVPVTIVDLSTTASSNDPQGTETIGTNLDNYLRAIQKIIRDESINKEWQLQEGATTYASATTFTITGVDVTGIYSVGRRVKAVGSLTGTIYGKISASAFVTNTTVTVVWDSGSLSSETLEISLGAIKGSPTGALAANARSIDFDVTTLHGTDVASATTLVLNSTTGNIVDVTGTTQIDAITLAEGRVRTLRFTDALTITHGASLVLPGAANIVTAAGDYAIVAGYGSSVVRVVHYQKASLSPTNPTFSGNVTFGGQIILPSDGELTIATGVITITGSSHTIDTESDAATDDLVTISGGSTGTIVEFRLENAARDVVFKHGSGNIQNPNSADITMGAANDRIYYKYDGTNWVFLFKNFNVATLTLGTAVAANTGTSVAIATGLPAGIKRIHIMFNEISVGGTSHFLVQIGDSGGIETTGYDAGSGKTGTGAIDGGIVTSGFIMVNHGAAEEHSGIMTLTNISGTTWISSHNMRDGTNGNPICGAGSKTLSGTLDRITLTTVSGDTFDASGTAGYMYDL